MDMNRRKTYIDMTKGIGILLVIFGHSIWNRFVEWQCTFFMPMFFLCSGLCYSKPKMIRENAKKILIPYYIAGGGGFCIETGLSIIKDGMQVMPIARRLLRLLIGTSMWNYPLWFLVAFFVCKCLFDWIIKIVCRGNGAAKAQGQRANLYLCAAGAACFALGLYLASLRKGFFYPFRADIGITMVPFMLAGYLLKDFCGHMEEAPLWKKLGLAFALLVLNLISFYNNTLVSVNSSDYGNPALFLLGAISGSGFILLVCQATSGISVLEKVLSWYGRNSMIIMCIHAIVLHPIVRCLIILNRFIEVSNEILGFATFFCCALLMVLCVACLNAFKKRRTSKI